MFNSYNCFKPLNYHQLKVWFKKEPGMKTTPQRTLDHKLILYQIRQSFHHTAKTEVTNRKETKLFWMSTPRSLTLFRGGIQQILTQGLTKRCSNKNIGRLTGHQSQLTCKRKKCAFQIIISKEFWLWGETSIYRASVTLVDIIESSWRRLLLNQSKCS